MNFQQMLALESRNFHKIYLYMDIENDRFNAYEFSAYLLTRLFDTLELKELKTKEVIYATQLPARFVVNTFTGHNTMAGEEYIEVTLDDTNSCTRWRAEFDKRKKEIYS